MSEEVRSIGPICADLEAKGEREAAFVLDRIAKANAEWGEKNAEILKILEAISNWDQHLKEDEDGEIDFEEGYHQVIAAARAGISIANGVYDE